MNKQLTNAVYGVLDYTSYPLGMLLVAPVVLHRQGAAEYGLWITSTAVISAGGIIASGFSDANIQRAAQHRGKGDLDSISNTTGSMLGINLVLGALISICVWIAAPLAANHMAVSTPTTAGECLFCLRAASIGIFLRALEAVAVSTHRAFEDYRYTVRISTTCRITTLGIAALLACLGQRMSSILMATVLVLAIGVYLQFWSLRPFLQPGRLRPRVHSETRNLLSLGVFPWLQALTSIIFGQLDRILLGVYVGTLAVAPYALCVQFAQPIVGVAASGLSFLFPYLSKRVDSLSAEDLKRTLLKAFACNLLVAFCGVLAILTFGTHLIQLWAGATVARSANDFLVPITVGSALAGLGTTAIYAMQSMGMFRVVALITIGGRGGMLLVMSFLLHRFGIQGLAYSRLCYGVIPLLIYIPLYRAIHTKKQRSKRDEQPLSVAYHEVPTL